MTDGLAGRRVLVTGAGGFIGSRLCRRLVDDGAEVYALSRGVLPRSEADIAWIQADLAALSEARDSLAETRPDVILHLASRVVGGRELEFVQPTLRDNLTSTVNVLTAAVEQGTERVVLAGSMEEPSLDGPPGAPASPYAAAKSAATSYALMFHALYGLSVVSLRIFMVYGPGQEEPRLIPYVVRSLLRGESPRLTSGTRPIDWVYVDDVVDAFLLASVAKDVDGAIVDIGSGEPVTIRDLVEMLRLMVSSELKAHFGSIPDRPFETGHAADVGRTKSRLGWQPRTTLHDGLLRTIEWLRAGPIEKEATPA